MAASFTAGFWLNFIIRLLRSNRAAATTSAPFIRRILRNTRLQSAAGFLTHGISTCSSSRFIRTESFKPPANRAAAVAPALEPDVTDASSVKPNSGDEPRTSSTTTNAVRNPTEKNHHDFAIFKSPSFPSVIAKTVKFIKHSAAASASKSMTPSSQRNPAQRAAATGSNSARYLWTRVRIAAGINLRTAEEIAAFVDQLRKHDTATLASMQKPLEDLFLRYLRISAPDSGVALAFLHVIDPVV